MEMEDVQISYDTSESQGFVFEFKTFCTILHDNLLKDGKFHQIMTSDVEKGLVQYLLTPQDDASCSEELSNWLQQYVFCVVSNEEQTTFELHIWMDDQKRVASIENYYTMLSSLYSQLGRVTPEYFLKKVNENYALLPEEVTMYFINHCIGHKESKTKAVPKSHENKENLVYGCKIISYEYIKQKVIKRKVLTEVFNKTSGKVVQSKCQEEDPSDDFIYCVQKNEKLCDITNTKRTEVSTTNYTSNQALEVKFLNRTVLAYFPPDEMQNHDHLVTLSDLIYKDQEISSVNTDEIQMEFIVPQKLPEKCMVDLQSIFSTSENKSLFPESDHVYEKSSSKKMKKAVKKPKTTPGNPKIVVNPPGKLTIVTDKNNKGATLKCIPVDFIAETPPQELSYSALSAAAGPAEEPDENDGDGVFNHLENDVTMDDNVTEKMADTISKQVSQTFKRSIKKSDGNPRLNFIKCARKVIKTERLVSDLECDVCSKISCDLTAARRHRKIHDNPEYKCHFCGKIYNSESGLLYHKSNHKIQKDVVECQYCGKQFDNSHLLRQHVRKSHLKLYKKEHPCKYCDRVFTSYSGCRHHIEGVHGMQPAATKPEGPLEIIDKVCHHCNKSYKQQRSLHEHLKLHRCPICKLEFKTLKFANQHRRDNHFDELAVICQYCEKKCFNRKALRIHLEVHQSASYQECSVCLEYFDDDDKLEKHVLVHDFNVYPFKCSICPETFPLRKQLDVHLSDKHCDLTNIKKEPTVCITQIKEEVEYHLI